MRTGAFCLALLSLTVGLAALAQTPGGGNALRQRLKALEPEYRRKKAQGYDLAEVDRILADIQKARQQGDGRRMRELAEQAETAFRRARLPKPAPSQKPATDNPETSVSLTATGAGPEPNVAGFRYGLEFATPGLAATYRSIGARGIKFSLVNWGRAEPAQPVNGVHVYHWEKLDQLVTEYQRAGFDTMMFVVKSLCSWGCVPARTKVSKDFFVSTPPRPEHLADYEAFVFNLVERYDGDGTDDMPGLKSPVRYFEIESEAQHPGYWQGSVEDYGRMLRTAYRAAKRASPDCRVVLAGMNLTDIFDDLPGDEVFSQRLAKLKPREREIFDFIRRSLQFQDAYDEVEFHYNRGYRGIYGTVRWIRGEMQRAGQQKPIWAGDLAAAPMFDTFFVGAYTKAEAQAVVSALKDPQHPRHSETERRYQSQQANNLVKKLVLAQASGLEGAMVGTLEDWPDVSYTESSWVWQGLINRDRSPRPAFHAYRLLIEKLRGAEAMSRLELGPHVYAYELTGPSRLIYVLWAEEAEREVRLPVPFEEARLTVAVPVDRAGNPQVFEARATDGGLTLRLKSTPLYIEQAEP